MFTSSSEKRNTTADGNENQLSTVFGYLDFASKHDNVES